MGSNELLVVKFGGTALSTKERVEHAAELVVQEVYDNNKVVVVVSAMGSTTDTLLQLFGNVGDQKFMDEVLSMGERTSARIFSSTLVSRGVKATFLDPSQDDWPILTDEKYGNARIMVQESHSRIRQLVEKLLKEFDVVVFPGFVGKSPENRVTTLGRGGSDSTTFVLASALNPKDTILVTSASGIMSADPRIVKSAKRLDSLTTEELAALADVGVKFIHKSSLKYIPPSFKVRVISYDSKSLSGGGTLVLASAPPLSMEVIGETISAVMFVGRSIRAVSRAIDILKRVNRDGLKLLGIVSNNREVLAYFIGNPSEDDVQKMHDGFLLEEDAVGLAVRKGLRGILIHGTDLHETPGVLYRISAPMAKEGINIHGILTLGSYFILVLPEEYIEIAFRLLEDTFRIEED
ncbi:MAG: amino acid kinase family protein [Thermoproteota archaeon]